MLNVHRRPRWLLATAVAVVGALVATACGDDSASDPTASRPAAVDCPGAPVKLMTITNLTPKPGASAFPDVPAGAEAAAATVNQTCELGRPVEIISCDDHFSPNDAAACGRQAVSEDVIATAMTVTGFGDSFLPILTDAGIPSFNGGTGPGENSAANSFPLSLPLPMLIGGVSGMAATGAKKIALVRIDIPSVEFVANLAKAQAAKVGMTVVGDITMPPTATDMTQVAAQVISSGAEAYTIVAGNSQISSIIKAVQQQGGDPDELKLFIGALGAPPAVLSGFSGGGEGIYLFGNTWPVDDTDNPGIKKYREELAAIGLETPENLRETGVLAWTSVHNIVNLLKGGPIDAATLLEKMKTAKINEPQVAPFDFSVNAFPDDPVLSKFRLFSNQITFSRFTDGKLVPLTDGFVDELTVPTLND